jgi:cob(I)alamin adenosyltransferase
VQAARVCGAEASVQVVPLPWPDLGRPLAFAEPEDTDLAALVAQVRQAARRGERHLTATRLPDT